MTITINGTTGITQPADNLAGSSSGTVTVQPAAAAGTWTMTLPTTAGTNGYVLGTDGTGVTNWVATAGALPTPTTAGNVIFTTDGSTWSSTQKIVLGTSQAATSGTSIAFTNIPAWAKRITVQLQGVSTSGTSNMIVQLGTGGTPTYTTSGYLGSRSTIFNSNSTTATSYSAGFLVGDTFAQTYIMRGTMVISMLTGNTWIESHNMARSDVAMSDLGAGSIALGAALTAIRVTTVNGTDTFDAGNINIIYE